MHVCLKKKKNSIHVLHPFCTNALKSSVSPQLLSLSTCPWKKPQPKATRFTVFGGKHYWTEHSPKGLTQCPKARVIRVRARRLLEPCLRTAVTATGSKGKRERLLERKRSWWQRHLNVRFNQKNKLLQILCLYVGTEGKSSPEDSNDTQEEAWQNKEGSELESADSSDTSTSGVHPSRCICYVLCIATDAST